MPSSWSLLRSLRAIHLYVGVITAPALLFFAFTGALQTAGLHESVRGSNYQPPRWAVVLAQLHKKQTMVVPERSPAPTPGSAAAPSSADPGRDAQTGSPSLAQKAHRGPSPVPLKAFFLLVCLGLASSTVSGIYLSFKYLRAPLLILGLLLAGTILPVLLAFL